MSQLQNVIRWEELNVEGLSREQVDGELSQQQYHPFLALASSLHTLLRQSNTKLILYKINPNEHCQSPLTISREFIIGHGFAGVWVTQDDEFLIILMHSAAPAPVNKRKIVIVFDLRRIVYQSIPINNAVFGKYETSSVAEIIVDPLVRGAFYILSDEGVVTGISLHSKITPRVMEKRLPWTSVTSVVAGLRYYVANSANTVEIRSRNDPAIIHCTVDLKLPPNSIVRKLAILHEDSRKGVFVASGFTGGDCFVTKVQICFDADCDVTISQLPNVEGLRFNFVNLPGSTLLTFLNFKRPLFIRELFESAEVSCERHSEIEGEVDSMVSFSYLKGLGKCIVFLLLRNNCLKTYEFGVPRILEQAVLKALKQLDYVQQRDDEQDERLNRHQLLHDKHKADLDAQGSEIAQLKEQLRALLARCEEQDIALEEIGKQQKDQHGTVLQALLERVQAIENKYSTPTVGQSEIPKVVSRNTSNKEVVGESVAKVQDLKAVGSQSRPISTGLVAPKAVTCVLSSSTKLPNCDVKGSNLKKASSSSKTAVKLRPKK